MREKNAPCAVQMFQTADHSAAMVHIVAVTAVFGLYFGYSPYDIPIEIVQELTNGWQ